MGYETKVKGSSYSASSGKKTDEVKTGCFVIEHIGTGKFIAAASATASVDASKAIQALHADQHPNKPMQGVCHKDGEVRVYEYPTKTVKQAEAVLKEIQNSVEPKYLFLGGNSEVKKCRAKARNKKSS